MAKDTSDLGTHAAAVLNGTTGAIVGVPNGVKSCVNAGVGLFDVTLHDEFAIDPTRAAPFALPMVFSAATPFSLAVTQTSNTVFRISCSQNGAVANLALLSFRVERTGWV